jgi:hypothetical protein
MILTKRYSLMQQQKAPLQGYNRAVWITPKKSIFKNYAVGVVGAAVALLLPLGACTAKRLANLS